MRIGFLCVRLCVLGWGVCACLRKALQRLGMRMMMHGHIQRADTENPCKRNTQRCEQGKKGGRLHIRGMVRVMCKEPI